jgi:hypothetical protein
MVKPIVTCSLGWVLLGGAAVGLTGPLQRGVALQGEASQQGQAAEQARRAPDGLPGLAALGGAGELGRVLRSPRGEEERDLVRGLRGLPTEFAISQELLRRELDRRGYFQLLEGGGPRELEQLLAAAADLGVAAGENLRGPQGELFARIDADLTLRLARHVLEGAGQEIDDLRGGLALLLAFAEGRVGLRDGEARAIANRIDLAAALLRALVRDAETLARSGVRSARQAGQTVCAQQLLAAAGSAGEGNRRRLAELRSALEREAGRMAGELSTPRLRARVADDLRRREGGRLRAQELLVEVRRLAPYTPEGVEASTGLAGLAGAPRYGLARRSALEALGYDPLAAEHAYHVGRATHLLEGETEASGWFRRFLVLRGIRADREGSYRDRTLCELERCALERLQRPIPGR